MATDELVFMTGPGPRPLCPYCEAEMGFTTHNMPQCPDAGCISNNPKGMELVNGLMDGIHEMGKQIRELQEENERLKARVERLRAYIKVVNPYSMDIVPQRVNLAAVKAFMALEDADLSDPAPDAGQEVG